MDVTEKSGYIIFKKDNETFSVSQTIDNDIWFSCAEPCFTMNLDIYSRDWNERAVACELFKLMQLIVGNYILEEHDKKEMIPRDFIDLKNKIITWHSDNENDNVLQLAFDERYVTVAMTKEKKSQNNLIRIRTNGSEYGIYHMFFTEFHKNITEFINKVDSTKEQESNKQKAKKKISLKNILNRK